MSSAPPGFACLWCGQPHAPGSPDDLEAFARLCPECLGRAGENQFLRFRLKRALEERAASRESSQRPAGTVPALAPSRPAGADLDTEMRAYYAARAPEYDDFYLRRGRYERGPVHDMAWQMELDQATRWLDDLPLGGEILELAAGTGWWSPLLAQKGHLTISDANQEPLRIATRRLEAHGQRVGVALRDAWEPPDRTVDGLFAGFWLSHVTRGRLPEFLALARQWLRPGGRFAFIDSRHDPQGSAWDRERDQADADVQLRQVADGRQYRVVKVFYEPAELAAALDTAGFERIDVRETARFFLLGSAIAR